MEQLPSSIEAYLLDAGFTGTEIVVLKKLLEEDALTLRQLAAKTGKSTGVLDQATRKLIAKGILRKENINDAPKFTLCSIGMVVDWVERDLRGKQDALMRKHENFQSFIASVTHDNARPEMEHFEGMQGLEKAYMKLLKGADEMLHYIPIAYKEEDDPLRAFRVQYFRERRKRDVFSRVIAHDTPLGRRFQSRDAFEYRKTLLVQREQCPFEYEKIIAGDMIACIDLAAQSASIVRFPQLANTERTIFESLWQTQLHKEQDKPVETDEKGEVKKIPVHVPRKTAFFSELRDFFLSRKSIATVAVLGILSAALTYGLYLQNQAINIERVRERAKSIAATGSLQFDPADLNELRTPADIAKPQYAKVIYQLNEIRRQNEGVTYIYIMRPTHEPGMLEFVADADSIDPSMKKDLNHDGLMNEADLLSPPGELYDGSEIVALQPMFTEGISTADPEPYEDQWGVWISGHGPIKNENGEIVAFLGVDIDAMRVAELTENTFAPFYWFIGLFLLFLFIRLAAFNRSLLNELVQSWKSPTRLKLVLTAGGLALFLTAGMYMYQRHQALQQLREKVTTIAATAAPQFDEYPLEELQDIEDAQSPLYRDVVLHLARIQQQNPQTMYAYILRPTEKKEIFTFIASSDSLDPSSTVDSNGDGELTEADELVVPGLPYDISEMDVLMSRSYLTAKANKKPYTDQWGTFITGYAPIRARDGTITGIFSVDIEAKHIGRLTAAAFSPLIVFIAMFGALLLFRSPHFSSSLLYKLLRYLKNRTVILVIIFFITLCAGLYVAFKEYTTYIRHQEIGRRLMAIAATAAPMFDPADLEKLHKAGDMQTPEYQRVFKQLNDIRKRNPDITYAYIIRPTDVEGIWTFVADADSNFYLPEYYENIEIDGIVTEADENTPTGIAYDISYSFPLTYKQFLTDPTYDLGTVSDQWGFSINASAPIIKNGTAVAILSLDIVTDRQ